MVSVSIFPWMSIKEGEKYLAHAVEVRPDMAKYHANLGEGGIIIKV